MCVVVTTSGLFSVLPLRCALDVFGLERVLFSIDWPFVQNEPATLKRWGQMGLYEKTRAVRKGRTPFLAS